MPKYMILYNSPESASDAQTDTSPEEQKNRMKEWIDWKNQASKTIKLEVDMPMQVVSRINIDGKTTHSDNQTSGYAFMEGTETNVLRALESHPHLQKPGASIDILEILSIPQM